MQTMSHEENPRLPETLIGRFIDTVSTNAKRLGARSIELVAICGNAWAAANAYEDLSRLSDAELDRRGIPRRELNRYVRGLLDKPENSGTEGRS